MKTTKADRRAINGIILINKPGLLTSNAVLQQVKRLYRAQKAGHMGSLDPLATGMLPICFGEATKFAHCGLEADKSYEVTAQFGVTTNTGDSQGEILTSTAIDSLSCRAIEHIIPTFLGESLQIPPMYSALKHQGKKLYELARAGIEIERQPRPIILHHLTLLQCDLPYARFSVGCSKGTYIRSLIEDIGAALGVGAHVTQLHRDFTAGFEQQTMFSLEELSALSEPERDACLLPVDFMLQALPIIILDEITLGLLYQGRMVAANSMALSGQVRVYNQDNVYQGLADWDAENELLAPKRLMANPKC